MERIIQRVDCSLLPAKSPRIYLRNEFQHSIENTWLRKFLSGLIHQDGSSGSFPSGHVGETLCVGISALILRIWPLMAKSTIVGGILMATSVVWLRYHYFVDTVAGFAVCIFAICVSGVLSRPPLSTLSLIPALPPEQAPLSIPEEFLSRMFKREVILFQRVPQKLTKDTKRL